MQNALVEMHALSRRRRRSHRRSYKVHIQTTRARHFLRAHTLVGNALVYIESDNDRNILTFTGSRISSFPMLRVRVECALCECLVTIYMFTLLSASYFLG